MWQPWMGRWYGWNPWDLEELTPSQLQAALQDLKDAPPIG